MRIYLLAYLLIYASTIVGQTLPEELTPPNSIKLKDNLYIDKTEIANIHWLEILHYYNLDSARSDYLSMLPDTTVWDNVAGTDSTWGNFYLRFPKNRYKPIVGVTKEQAEKYCKWRSFSVNGVYNKKHSKKLQREGIDSVIYQFRLPTVSEWKMAAFGENKTYYTLANLPLSKPKLSLEGADNEGVHAVLSDTVNYNKFKIDVATYVEQLRPDFQLLPDSIPYFVTLTDLMPRKNYEGTPNALGVFHTIGNVAEMVANENVVMGGSWLHTFEKVNQAEGDYWDGKKAQSWIGFRCVCEVTIIGNDNTQ